MTINYTGSVSFTKIRSEFAGYSGSVKLSNYRIGGGFTANHENNKGLATSNSNLKMSDWWRKDKDFESDYGLGYRGSTDWTAGFYQFAATSLTGTPISTYEGWDTGVYASIGTFGFVGSVGVSVSSAVASKIYSIIDYTYSFAGANPVTSYLYIQGNYTGSWWTSITVSQLPSGTSVTLLRTQASQPTGAYDSVNGITTWEWYSGMLGYIGSNGPFRVGSGVNYRITITV